MEIVLPSTKSELLDARSLATSALLETICAVRVDSVGHINYQIKIFFADLVDLKSFFHFDLPSVLDLSATGAG